MSLNREMKRSTACNSPSIRRTEDPRLCLLHTSVVETALHYGCVNVSMVGILMVVGKPLFPVVPPGLVDKAVIKGITELSLGTGAVPLMSKSLGVDTH